MRVQKKVESGGGDSWMNTYSDMVTLLLCFFVLLYSMSSIDSNKWQILVKSFNPNAAEETQIVTGETKPGKDNIGAEGDHLLTDVEEFDQLYWAMQEFVQQNNLGQDVEINKGEGFVFITFKNNIFFDGNSYTLRLEGAKVLNALSKGMKKIQKQINEVRVLGHTNQADPNKPNSIYEDRTLSSRRASEVLVYLQERKAITGKKIIDVGCGQNFPVAPYDTEENRMKNRRVEIVISKSDSVYLALEDIYKELGIGTEDKE